MVSVVSYKQPESDLNVDQLGKKDGASQHRFPKVPSPLSENKAIPKNMHSPGFPKSLERLSAAMSA